MNVVVKKKKKAPPMEYPIGSAPLLKEIPSGPTDTRSTERKTMEWTGKKADYLPLLKRKAKKYMSNPSK